MKNLIPAIIQNGDTGLILMLGYMNDESLEKTLQTKKVWFYSRSRKCLWLKGETSKNYLFVKQLSFDCDKDAILIKVIPAGPTCHLGTTSCFEYNKENDINIISELYSVIEARKKEMPQKSYTTQLFKKGIYKIVEKIMEEAEEVCRAAKQETKKRVMEESVDVIYHLITLLVLRDIKLKEVLGEIKMRRKKPTN